jgi:hypothetical protein
MAQHGLDETDLHVWQRMIRRSEARSCCRQRASRTVSFRTARGPQRAYSEHERGSQAALPSARDGPDRFGAHQSFAPGRPP